jgi:hypothetical protein
MFGLFLAVGMSMAPPPAARTELTIPIDYRWALLSGLQRRLGGNFIITGLKGAQGDCDHQRSCATPAAIDVLAPLAPANRDATGTSGLKIYGKSPVAIVSVVDAKWVGYSLNIHLAVFDPVRRTVTHKRAEVDIGRSGINSVSDTKRLRALDDI